MLYSNTNTLTISVSQEPYWDKKIASACVGATKGDKGKQNRKIRMDYGYSFNDSVSYNSMQTDLKGLFEFQLHGHSVCYNFNVPARNLKNDGSFGAWQKVDANFNYTQVIFVDIDHTSYTCTADVISRLSFAPSFWLTTYSNNQVNEETGENKGLRMRLAYAVEDKIYGKYFYRFCTNNLNQLILEDLKSGDEGIELDTCNLSCAQYFNGTNIDNPELSLTVEGKCNNIWYSLEDFGCTDESKFISYLENFCYYTSYNKDRVKDVKAYLEGLTGKEYDFNKDSLKFVERNKANYFMATLQAQCADELGIEEVSGSKDFSPTSEYFLKRWDIATNYSEFVSNKKWTDSSKATERVYRVIKGAWCDDSWQIIDDDYFELWYEREIITDGNNRRKKLYQLMCLKRIIKPSITKDELLIDIIREIWNHFDNTDRKIDSEFLRTNIINCFQKSIDELKEELKDRIEVLKAKTTKAKGVIYINDKVQTTETKYKILDKFVDRNKSFKENLKELNTAHGKLVISDSLLYEYLKSRNIRLKDDNGKISLSDEDLIKVLDANLSVRKNKELLKKANIKCDTTRLTKLLKQLKEGVLNFENALNKNNNFNLKEELHPFPPKEGEQHSSAILEKQNTLGADVLKPTNNTFYSTSEVPVEKGNTITLNEWGNPAFGSYTPCNHEAEESKPATLDPFLMGSPFFKK